MTAEAAEPLNSLARLAQQAPALTIDSADGVPVTRLGLITTLYFSNGHAAETRQRLAECFERFHKSFRPALKWQWLERLRRLNPAGFAACRSRMLRMDPEMPVHWALSSAPPTELATHRLWTVMTGELQARADLSCLKMVLPWSVLAEPDGLKTFDGWVRSLSSAVRAEHGFAGLACVLALDGQQRHWPVEYRLARAYSGLMVDPQPHIDSLRLLGSIKGASWYTVLGDSFVKRLGGNDALRGRASAWADVLFSAYEGGLLIRAGDVPGLGGPDQDHPPAYVRVNRLIRPVRLRDTGCLHPCLLPGPGFSEFSTACWYARFDDQPAPMTRAGQPCPQSGYWFSSAMAGSRRWFEQGEVMPGFAGVDAARTQWFHDCTG